MFLIFGFIMKNNVNPKTEIALSISLIIFSIIVYYFSLELPEPEYEPLGSAALPQGLAVIMSLLSLKENSQECQAINYCESNGLQHKDSYGATLGLIIF